MLRTLCAMHITRHRLAPFIRAPYAYLCIALARLPAFPRYTSACSCATLAPARLFLSLCYFLSLDGISGLWQFLNKTRTSGAVSLFAKIMKDKKYLSFLAVEKFLLTTPNGFDTIGLFSGDRASERVSYAPKASLLCVCT